MKRLLAVVVVMLAALLFAPMAFGQIAPSGCFATIDATNLPSSGGTVNIGLGCPNPAPYGIYATLLGPKANSTIAINGAGATSDPRNTAGVDVSANNTSSPVTLSWYWHVCDSGRDTCVNTNTVSTTVAPKVAQCTLTISPTSYPASGGFWTLERVDCSNLSPNTTYYVTDFGPTNVDPLGQLVDRSQGTADFAGTLSLNFPPAPPLVYPNSAQSPRVDTWQAYVCSTPGCTPGNAIASTNSVQLTVAAAPPNAPTGCVATINGVSSAALSSSGGSVNLAVSGCIPSGGLTYNWSRNGAAGANSAASWTDTPAANSRLGPNSNTSASVTSTYQVQVCNGSACVTVPATALTAVVAPAPAPSTVTGCVATVNNATSYTLPTSSGGAVTLNVSGCNPNSGLTYNWSRNGASNANSSATWTDNAPTNTGTTAATYTYAVQVCNGGGCMSAGPVTATVPAAQGTTGTGTPVGAVSGGSGSGFSALVRDDGTLWSWGDNSQNSLGDGSAISRSVPGQVSGVQNVAAASTSSTHHTLALDSSGNVSAWGVNTYGELGNGNQIAQATPISVPIAGVTAVATGQNFSIVLRNDRTVWSWGRNDAGQLGNGSLASRSSPGQVQGLSNIVSIAASGSHAVAATADGRVFTWGNNFFVVPNQSNVPIQVTISDVRQVFAGGDNTFALKNDGTLWAWGPPTGGRLGNGGAGDGRSPVQVTGLSNIVQVVAGDSVSMALAADGSLWGWGQNEKGQLGLGNVNPVVTPVRLAPTQRRIRNAAAGDSNFVVDDQGRVYGAGSNQFGSLGVGDTLNTRAPQAVAGIDSVIAVATTATASIALRADKSIWTWGANDPTDVNGTATPHLLSSGGGDGGGDAGGNGGGGSGGKAGGDNTSEFLAIAGGPSNAAAVRADGIVFGWGALVPGLSGAIATPTPVPGLANIRTSSINGGAIVASGGAGIIALTNGGKAIIACGGTYACPGSDFGFSDVVAVAAGLKHFLALRADGSVWAWGANDKGQLGIGSTLPGANPVAVSGLPLKVARIAAGNDFSIAVLSDGTAYAWGQPPSSLALQTLPVRVIELDGSVQLAASFHLLSLDQLGRGRAWGPGSRVGERDRVTPAREPRMDGLVALAAGPNHSLGINARGDVIAWGQNPYQQLGLSRQQNYTTWQTVNDRGNPVFTADAVPVVEYVNPSLIGGTSSSPQAHYFITADKPEQNNLDSGRPAGWQRTGRAWRAWRAGTQPSNAKPVYRFFSSRWNSHFYTADEAERALLLSNNPTQDDSIDWKQESIAFYAAPSATTCPSLSVGPTSPALCAHGEQPTAQNCPAGYYPVYRAYDNRSDPNHRISSNWIDIYRAVRFFGFIYEGVGFCAPASSQPGGDLQAFNTYPGGSVNAGDALNSDYWFANAGPGAADGAKIVAVLPANWQAACSAYNGAQCPAQLDVDSLRQGVVVPQLPAGGVLRLIATGQAPAEPQVLTFTSSIGAPSQAPDPYGYNNAAAVSQTTVNAGCAVVANPETINMSAAGSTGQLQVDAACAFSGTSDQSWLDVAPAPNNTLTITASPNAGNTERLATITVKAANGSTVLVPVRQPGASADAACSSVRLSKVADQLGRDRVPGFVDVEAPTIDCSWDAKVDSKTYWITLTGATRRGNGTVEYIVQDNLDGQSRTGKLLVGGQTVIIYQTSTLTYSDGGGSGDGGGDGSGSGGDGGG